MLLEKYFIEKARGRANAGISHMNSCLNRWRKICRDEAGIPFVLDTLFSVVHIIMLQDILCSTPMGKIIVGYRLTTREPVIAKVVPRLNLSTVKVHWYFQNIRIGTWGTGSDNLFARNGYVSVTTQVEPDYEKFARKPSSLELG